MKKPWITIISLSLFCIAFHAQAQFSTHTNDNFNTNLPFDSTTDDNFNNNNGFADTNTNLNDSINNSIITNPTNININSIRNRNRNNNFNNNLNTTGNLNSLLLNFNQLVRAVEQADDVKAILFFERCELQNQNQNVQAQIMRNLEGASTRFNFTQFLHAKERISDEQRDRVTTEIKSYFEHPSTGDLWMLLGRLTVFEDNTALLRVSLFDAVSHKKQIVLEWLCDISNGRDDKGLLLFDFP